MNIDLQDGKDKQTQPDLSEDFRQQIEGDAGIVYKLQVQLKTDVTDDECCDADWNAQEVGATSGNLKSKILYPLSISCYTFRRFGRSACRHGSTSCQLRSQPPSRTDRYVTRSLTSQTSRHV